MYWSKWRIRKKWNRLKSGLSTFRFSRLCATHMSVSQSVYQYVIIELEFDLLSPK